MELTELKVFVGGKVLGGVEMLFSLCCVGVETFVFVKMLFLDFLDSHLNFVLPFLKFL